MRFAFTSLITRILTGLFVFTSLTTEADVKAWRFSKEQDDVVVYERYRDGLPLKQYRGVVEVNARPDKVVRFLQQIDNIDDWHYRVAQVELLQTVGMTSGYVHIINSAPWPVKWRDVVCRIDLIADSDSGQVHIRLTSIDDYLVSSPDFIRAPTVEALWVVSPTDKGSSEVVYELFVDPGGRLPKWLFNSVAMDVPLYTLINLRTRINDGK